MKKSFEYWKKQHQKEQLEEFSSDNEGLLWLKTKSIVRKQIIAEFLDENKIELSSTRLSEQFPELFVLLSANPKESHKKLDAFIAAKNKQQLAQIDEKKLVSELYKLKSFDWGGDHQNSLDKYLVSRYVKVIQSYDSLVSKFDTEISAAVQGYVLNSWYNHWSSILIEHIFKSHNAVQPTVGQIKHVDFFINNIPMDLKVTYLPGEYIKKRRRELGLPVELTYLKKKARALEIDFDKNASSSDIYYEITEKLKDKGTKDAVSALETLKGETMKILNEVRDNPKKLARFTSHNSSSQVALRSTQIFLRYAAENFWRAAKRCLQFRS